MSDVTIVGGGVIGLALARALAGRGTSVTVLEPGPAGSGATRAAAGILSPTDPSEWVGDLGALNARAIAMWRDWASGVESEVGLPSGYEARGELRVGQAGDAFMQATVDGAKRAGWRCDRLTEAEVAELEAGVRLGDRDCLHLPGTGCVNTDALIPALVASCQARGVELRTGEAVEVDLSSGSVRTRDGLTLQSDATVVATGVDVGWAGLSELAVRPVLGESVIVRDEQTLCTLPVRSSKGSVVPRSDGTYWLGTTVLERGFQRAPSAGSVHGILANAISLLPSLGDAEWVDARSGLRPVSADGMPIVGPVSQRVAVAVGHGREGIIQSPLCAELVADGLAGRWSDSLEPFSPARFAA